MPIIYYDDDGKATLTAPELPARAIRHITKGAFYGRLTLNEALALEDAKETDKVLRVLDKRLDRRTHVDLDFPELLEGLQYMVSVGILTAERVTELRADGSPDEEYTGV